MSARGGQGGSIFENSGKFLRRNLWVLGLLGLAFGGPGAAEGLDGAGVAAALTGQRLVYEDGSSQTFRADGVTFYTAPGGAESQGRWRMEGDRYCSVWPPSDSWACYDVATGPGGAVDFVGSGGQVSRGRIAP